MYANKGFSHIIQLWVTLHAYKVFVFIIKDTSMLSRTSNLESNQSLLYIHKIFH